MSSPSFSPCAFSSFINGGGESKIEFEISLPKTREDRELDRGRGKKERDGKERDGQAFNYVFPTPIPQENKKFHPNSQPPQKSFESEIAPLRGGKGMEATCASLILPPFHGRFYERRGDSGSASGSARPDVTSGKAMCHSRTDIPYSRGERALLKSFAD